MSEMEFEWDEEKRLQVLDTRNLDILEAALIFEGEVITRKDEREDYGEERFISLGLVDGEAYIVVHTERNGVTRLITAWKGGRNDFRKYQEGVSRRDQSHEGPGGTPNNRG